MRHLGLVLRRWRQMTATQFPDCTQGQIYEHAEAKRENAVILRRAGRRHGTWKKRTRAGAPSHASGSPSSARVEREQNDIEEDASMLPPWSATQTASAPIQVTELPPSMPHVKRKPIDIEREDQLLPPWVASAKVPPKIKVASTSLTGAQEVSMPIGIGTPRSAPVKRRHVGQEGEVRVPPPWKQTKTDPPRIRVDLPPPTRASTLPSSSSWFGTTTSKAGPSAAKRPL